MDMIITTTNSIEGRQIQDYLGVVFGEMISGIDFVRDFTAELTNFFGGRSNSYEEELVDARKTALRELEERAARLGADAVVGVKMDYEVLGSDNGMLMVTVSGTAVTLKKEQNNFKILILNKGADDMKEQLAKIRLEALAAFEQAQSAAELDSLRVQYLGKKGELTAVLKMMGKLSAEERPAMGQLVNEVRSALEAAIEAAAGKLEAQALEQRLKDEALDVTIPGREVKLGHKHPMYLALDELKDIFIGMGFTVLDGPEVELAEYNFDKLNAEEGHPSRDWSDTFYFDADSRVMLRSQTSPMQVRAMETMELPIRIIAPGRVYRKDEVDATHSPMFHQVEGMVIDKNVTMADLKGTLNTVVEQLYGKGTKTRFRPHHFPFTEPSCEMDVQCHKCGGVGCPTCKGEGWIEMLGAGMIHPKVLKMAGIDPEVYSGWAFGIGLERTAMRRFKISDLRLIFENDVRFLEQF